MDRAVAFAASPASAMRAQGFDIGEEACGPGYGMRERRYGDFAVGFVLSGWFDYRAQGGAATAAPGALVLGNPGEPFTCRHLGAAGNRRLVVHFDPAFVEGVASDFGLDEARFPVAVLPPGAASVKMFGWMRKLARKAPGWEDAAWRLAAEALHAEEGRGPGAPVSASERRRFEAVVRHIETAYAEPCSLKTLAELAGLSRWHFLRRFHEVAGQSPNQYLIHTRIRVAAERLLDEPGPVGGIALDVGFNDISHFNACFRAVFGCTPTAWRAGRGR
jgi:AraC-like DNA-binding protein